MKATLPTSEKRTFKILVLINVNDIYPMKYIEYQKQKSKTF